MGGGDAKRQPASKTVRTRDAVPRREAAQLDRTYYLEGLSSLSPLDCPFSRAARIKVFLLTIDK